MTKTDIAELITSLKDRIESLTEIINAGVDLADGYESLAKVKTEQANQLDSTTYEAIQLRLEANRLRYKAALIDDKQLACEIEIKAKEELIQRYEIDKKQQTEMHNATMRQINKDREMLLLRCNNMIADKKIHPMDIEAAKGLKAILASRMANEEKQVQAFRDLISLYAKYKK